MGNTTPNESRSGLVNGVGQHGFVARHGLYTAEQAAAADAVASRIGDLDLRTVRLTVVDQHGVPRSKALSPEVAIAALSNGLDFSGAIYSLDTGNQVFVPAFAAWVWTMAGRSRLTIPISSRRAARSSRPGSRPIDATRV